MQPERDQWGTRIWGISLHLIESYRNYCAISIMIPETLVRWQPRKKAGRVVYVLVSSGQQPTARAPRRRRGVRIRLGKRHKLSERLAIDAVLFPVEEFVFGLKGHSFSRITIVFRLSENEDARPQMSSLSPISSSEKVASNPSKSKKCPRSSPSSTNFLMCGRSALSMFSEASSTVSGSSSSLQDAIKKATPIVKIVYWNFPISSGYQTVEQSIVFSHSL